MEAPHIFRHHVVEQLQKRVFCFGHEEFETEDSKRFSDIRHMYKGQTQ